MEGLPHGHNSFIVSSLTTHPVSCLAVTFTTQQINSLRPMVERWRSLRGDGGSPGMGAGEDVIIVTTPIL